MKQAVCSVVTGNVAFFFFIGKVKTAATEMPFLLVFCPVVKIHISLLMMGISPPAPVKAFCCLR